jgi:hypothetical protein
MTTYDSPARVVAAGHQYGWDVRLLGLSGEHIVRRDGMVITVRYDRVWRVRSATWRQLGPEHRITGGIDAVVKQMRMHGNPE